MSTIYVKKDGSGDALTIQQGIQLAQLGDIVEVEAGTFDENVDLWKGVILKGAGINQTIITGRLRSTITARAFVFVSGQATLSLTQAAIDAEQTTADYEVGRIVTASGIPANTRIVSKTPTTLTLSAAVTSAAASRTIAMGLQNDASLRVRGTNGVVRDLKVIGYDHPTNPGVEYSAIMFRPAALGSAAANGWELFNCEFVADGEYAILADFNAAIGNINIHDCKVSGKTFVGENPAIGNQFTVWNVPRQLVALQAPNFGITFQNNQITGVTGGLTLEGEPSFNTAVTIDAVGAVVSGNSINVESGTGFGLRVRGLNAEVSDNTLTGTSQGYYVLPNHAVNVLIPVGTMISNSSKFWICIQEHTSSTLNAPTGAEGASFWSEITIEDVNASGEFGIGLAVIGSNGEDTEDEDNGGGDIDYITYQLTNGPTVGSNGSVLTNEDSEEWFKMVKSTDGYEGDFSANFEFSGQDCFELGIGVAPTTQLGTFSDGSIVAINRSGTFFEFSLDGSFSPEAGEHSFLPENNIMNISRVGSTLTFKLNGTVIFTTTNSQTLYPVVRPYFGNLISSYNVPLDNGGDNGDGDNGNVAQVLVVVSQSVSGQPIKVLMSKAMVKAMSKVSQDATFSDEENWKLVSFIFKKKNSAQRLVSAFRDFDAEKSVRLKSGMAPGEEFELHKLIISTPDRTLLVMKREEIDSAESFDFVLQ